MIALTNSQMKEHNGSKQCHICFKRFTDKDRKVRDHCHYTGLYRGAAHSSCNLQYKIPNHIPVIFHNLAGYNAHLFIKELSSYTTDISMIAKSTENYISFGIRVGVDKYVDKFGVERVKEPELRFIDSFKFMSSSLDLLVNNLARSGHEFWGFENYSEDQKKLLIRKGVYPYEYMDSWDKMNSKLSCRDKFYSNLNMSGISIEDYKHAVKVRKEFKLNNMREYHDLYLRTYVMLLANVFEQFRRVCMDNYGLDPAHFYTAPGLAWKACLKFTRVKLELLKDMDMLLMFERGIRGGITQSVHRHTVVNNKYMEDYDSSSPSVYLQYLDANNLYGWAMSQNLPVGGFKSIDCKNIDIFELVKVKGKGYLLEVDVSYPEELHDYHNDLPFMCEKIKLGGVKKLIPNLYYKMKYVIHIRCLVQAVQHILVLEHIHRVIEFKE